MSRSYAQTRDRLEAYFDRTAAASWARLTSDAPVSRIRQTVREGRDQMRASLLANLPTDLAGLRLLDAGCGAGQLSIELAQRGAEVVGVDISPSLLKIARQRTPPDLVNQITYLEGDFAGNVVSGEALAEADWSLFDHVVAMDSLIHYRADDIALALSHMARRSRGNILFTLAPKTLLLGLMHLAGQVFPKSDRSPTIEPVTTRELSRALEKAAGPESVTGRKLVTGTRIARGFYISQAMTWERIE